MSDNKIIGMIGQPPKIIGQIIGSGPQGKEGPPGPQGPPGEVSLTQLNAVDQKVEALKTDYAKQVPLIDNSKRVIELLLNANLSQKYSFTADNSIKGKYWSIVNGNAGIVNQDGFYAYNALVPVTPGETLTLKNWGSPVSSMLAYAAYDTNGAPYNGSISRVNYSAGTYNATTDTYSFVIPVNCAKIGLCMPVDANREFTVGVATIGESVITFTTDMHNKINDSILIKDTKAISDMLYQLVKVKSYTINLQNSTYGAYWGTDATTKIATLVTYANYYAYKDFIPVNAGDKLKLVNWGYVSVPGVLAYSAYDNDNKPYNGTTSRINFSAGVYDATENSYTFTIPAGCTQIALSIQPNADNPLSKAVAYVGETNVNFTEKMKAMITDVVSQQSQNAEMDYSADFYQKGAAVKDVSSAKKIAIITAGQSNPDGRVPIANLPSYISLPLTKCNYASNYTPGGTSGTFQPSLAQANLSGGNKWAFDLVTYHYLTQVANQEIYVMKYTMGGTSIDPTGSTDYHWTVFYEQLASMNYSLLRKFEDLIRACVAAQGANFDIRAMLWHQGEGDTLTQASINNYYKNLKYLIAYCRGIVGNKRLPFICGTISHKSGQYNSTIDAAFRRLATEDPYFYLVDMSKASLLDSYHFDAIASEYLGKCMYDKLIEAGVISETKLNPVSPWS